MNFYHLVSTLVASGVGWLLYYVDTIWAWLRSEFDTLLVSVGGSLVVCLAVGRWVLERIGKKMEITWTGQVNRELEAFRNQNTAELEQLRSELVERRDDLASIRSALAVGHAASHDRVVESIGKLWTAMLRIRDFAGRMTVVHDFVLPNEFEDQRHHYKLLDMVPDHSDQSFMEEVQSLDPEIEPLRPFLGESLWRKYYVYRAFALRIAWNAHHGKQLGKLRPWDMSDKGELDTSLFQLLRIVLDDREIGELAPLPFAAPRALFDAMELKILDDMNEWLFGRRMASLTVEALRMVRTLSSPSR